MQTKEITLSVNKNKIRFLILMCMLFFIIHSYVHADGGYISFNNILVYEPSQSAIIGWNGTTEILILSTNVYVNNSNWAIELIPFPSIPSEIAAGTLEIFRTCTDYIDTQIGTPHAGDVDLDLDIDIVDALLVAQYFVGLKPTGFYKFAADVNGSEVIDIVDALMIAQYYVGLGGGRWEDPGDGINVVFQDQIGIHHITTVEADSASQLITFAEQVLSQVTATDGIQWSNFEDIAADYINRGIRYWVIDLLDLGDTEESRDPLIYSFETDSLFFPLIVSSLNSGETLIDIFTITQTELNREEIESAGFEGIPINTYYAISPPEVTQMSSELGDLFAPISAPLKIGRHYYSGSLLDLNMDLIVRERVE